MSKVIRVILAAALLCAVGALSGVCMGGCTMGSILEIDKEIYPDDFDLGLAREKGIGSKADYERVQQRYQELLGSYLGGLYDFSAADALLDAQGFQPAEGGGYYRGRSIPTSRYFYLRNNVHVERLSAEQIAYLKGSAAGSDDPVGVQIVKDTCEEVLAVRLSFANAEEYNTSYQKGSGYRGTVPNTAIVFYVEYKDIKPNNESYAALGQQEALVVEGISQHIILALEGSFDVDVIVFNESWCPGAVS